MSCLYMIVSPFLFHFNFNLQFDVMTKPLFQKNKKKKGGEYKVVTLCYKIKRDRKIKWQCRKCILQLLQRKCHTIQFNFIVHRVSFNIHATVFLVYQKTIPKTIAKRRIYCVLFGKKNYPQHLSYKAIKQLRK